VYGSVSKGSLLDQTEMCCNICQECIGKKVYWSSQFIDIFAGNVFWYLSNCYVLLCKKQKHLAKCNFLICIQLLYRSAGMMRYYFRRIFQENFNWIRLSFTRCFSCCECASQIRVLLARCQVLRFGWQNTF